MDIDTIRVVHALKKQGRHKQSLRLLTSKQSKSIIFSNNAFYHVDEKGIYHILSGLLPTLKRNFWPDTNMTRIMKRPKKDKKETKNGMKKAKKGTKTGGGGRFFGSIQGSRVHHELEDFILLDDKNFRKKHGSLHPWTKRILAYVVCQMKWLPLQCEYKVGDVTKRVGTAIDMICVNPVNGHLVFLEFKTGYKLYFENSDGRMSKCLSFMPNSPLNWANIQLTTAVIMLLRQNPTIKIEETSSFVIRIDDENLDSYHIDNTFISAMNPRLIQAIA